ncbi:MAG: acyl-CoA dehydrogenase family protein [Pseudomonadales bacterium]|jgi:acyl-CoA dehydrogenase|nr:acyl-CoA dehydrogenase family protein [Pseudomonadales bacterium]
MPIDFDVEPEFQEQVDWVEKFTKEEIEPLDNFMRGGRMKDGSPIDKDGWRAISAYTAGLRQQVKDRGLWGFHLGKDLGGPGLGQVKLCLLNEKLGRTSSGPGLFGVQAPDTGNMELIAHNGTEEQKKKYMEPLLSGEKHSAYSMTEPHAGEPGEFVCSAVRDGDEWVINGEKWFTSNGAKADFLIVMAVTAPEKETLDKASMFIVDRDTPGVEIVRNVHTIGTPLRENYNTERGGGHAYIRYDNVRVPAEALLGEEGKGFVGSQTRLSGGRVHHAMRAVGVCTKALDMMCERALSRRAKGQLLSELQMVQQDIADSYIQLKQFRLHVLYTAWLIDKTGSYTREIRKEIASIKISAAKVNHDIIYRAIHLHGALGMSNETPLGDMWMSAPWMGVMDGTTEVHKANLSKLLLRDYEPSDDLFPTYHLPKLIEAAQEKFGKVIDDHLSA